MKRLTWTAVAAGLMTLLYSCTKVNANEQRVDNQENPADSALTGELTPEQMKAEEEAMALHPFNVLLDDMVLVEGGTFMMGAPADDPDAMEEELPRHQVTLSDFYICKYEVTQELWNGVMLSNPSFRKGDKLPVEQVSWEEADEFVRQLAKQTAKPFRLPTEAEWEFAARGGNKSKGFLYSGSNDINEVAWYGDYDNGTIHEGGEKKPNELGLYDMSGNVCEWCSNWMGNYPDEPETDPQGFMTSDSKVFRGGSFGDYARNCRVTARLGDDVSIKSDMIGLRVAMDVTEP